MVYRIESNWNKIIPIIRKGARFVITGHEHADGDALGSQVALYYFLRQMGKRVRAINCDEPQRRLCFIDPDRVVETYEPEGARRAFAACDAWIIVDTSALLRIGSMGELTHRLTCPKIVIDHHVVSPEEAFADISIVDERAVATGKLIYQLGVELGCRLDKKIALALYTAIYTDSGGFVYAKMDAETHRIVAELIETGVRPYDVFDRLYQTHAAAEVELFGRALSSLRFEHGGQIAWMTVSGRMYAYSGADPEGSENHLLNYVRSIKTVELVALLRKLPEGRVKVSLRSKNFFRVNGIARDLGGGGHWFAAGAVVEGSLPRVREKVTQLVGREWRNRRREHKRPGA